MTREQKGYVYPNKYTQGRLLAGAKKVLNAAATTYVAATAMAVVQLIRMLVFRGRRD